MPAIPPMQPKKDRDWGKLSKTLSFWILLILIPIAFIRLTNAGTDNAPTITYSEYDSQLQKGNVKKVVVQDGKSITGEFQQPIPWKNRSVTKFNVHLPVQNSDAEFERLRQAHVEIAAEDAKPSIFGVFLQYLPFLLFIGFWLFFFKQMQAGGGEGFSFGEAEAEPLPRDTAKGEVQDVPRADGGEEG